ncbi:LysR family transcriptional regulator [Massilia agri]|uniref:LysR family transcriptional regulator n=1 Tax=Massilia agri TaxID=1886785 RepID=A0ABT2AQH2_9BURK|nr:LysR family transcriptional regulator [Massilia agri]MCS0598459.1 LysR family transcriptional regulator [Massilia agri]
MAFTSDNITVFLAVLDQGSFSAAARVLGRVPSAVSMTIAQLEAELDLRLFDRGTREPTPTEAARALAPRARQLASQLRQLRADALALHAGLERRLTLAVAPELIAAPWTPALAALGREYPSLEIAIVSVPQPDALRLLHAGGADLALVFERERLDERESFLQLGSDVIVAVAAPGFLPRERQSTALRVEDMLELRQIAMTSRVAEPVDCRFILSRQVWKTDNQLATLNLVQSGLGWAVLPRALVQPVIAAGSLVEIAFENASRDTRLVIDIVWSRERPLGLAARRYLELIRESAANP